MSNITRAHRCDLNALRKYLQSQGVKLPSKAMMLTEPDAWPVVTHDSIKSFVQYCLQKGMAVNSVNQRLSTIRKYARLAHQAGFVDSEELARIEAIKGFYQVDHKLPTDSDIERLRQQPTNSQGRRDRLLLDLLIEHGLRVREIEALQVCDVDIVQGEICSTRAETGIEQRHKLNRQTLQSLRDYFYSGDAPTKGALLRRSKSNNTLASGGISSRAIHKRVNTLGSRIGLVDLTPEDLQMYWRDNRK